MAHLLIVEDDPDALDALAEVLAIAGHEVTTARNGAEGLVQLSGRVPDLVLLDVEMPVLDGPGMAYRMFLHDMGLEEIPILVLSGIPDLRGVAASMGTPYFLAKPFTAERLDTAVARALAERMPPRPSLGREA